MVVSDHMEALCKIAKSYAYLTGLSCEFYLLEERGNCIDCNLCMPASLCALCRLSLPARDRCSTQLRNAGLLAFDLCRPYVFTCHFGLVEWAVPVIRKQEYLGVVIGGRVRLRKGLDGAEERLLPQLKQTQLSWGEVCRALLDMPYLTSWQIHDSSQMLFHCVCYNMQTDHDIINRQLRLWNDRSSIAEEISKQKLEQARRVSTLVRPPEGSSSLRERGRSGENPFGIPVQSERELVGRIHLGDRPAARKILNEIMGRIFLGKSGDLNMIKALLIELLISVVRAAIKRRTPGDNLFELYLQAVQTLHTIDTRDGIYDWTVRTFDRLTETIYSSRDDSKFAIVEQVVSYLKENYARDLNINDIAGVVNYSPFYLSRLFKEELGITIMDYLTEVRIARARELLESTNLLIDQVAKKTGYRDAAYFSRLFKKRVGISPGEYRRWWADR